MELFESPFFGICLVAAILWSLFLFGIIYAAVKPKRRDRIQLQNQQILSVIAGRSIPTTDQAFTGLYSKMDADEVRKEFINFKGEILKQFMPYFISIGLLLVILIAAVFFKKAS